MAIGSRATRKRNSEALRTLLTLMYEGDPFTVDAGDITLKHGYRGLSGAQKTRATKRISLCGDIARMVAD